MHGKKGIFPLRKDALAFTGVIIPLYSEFVKGNAKISEIYPGFPAK